MDHLDDISSVEQIIESPKSDIINEIYDSTQTIFFDNLRSLKLISGVLRSSYQNKKNRPS